VAQERRAIRVYVVSQVGDGSVTFYTNAAFAGQFEISIGDASNPLKPQLAISKDLPFSFTGTQSEKDDVASEFSSLGTGLGFQLVLKRRCR